MIEWDYGAVERKFAHSLSYISIDGEEVGWTPIGTISDEGCVFHQNKKMLGQYVTEMEGQRYEDFAVVTFHYKPLLCGWYRSKLPWMYYFVKRVNRKCWKIGLNDEGYSIVSYNLEKKSSAGCPYTVWGGSIDFSERVQLLQTEALDIFRPELSRWKNTFRVFDTDVGYIFNNKAILTSQHYQPLIAKYLEDRWPIVNL